MGVNFDEKYKIKIVKRGDYYRGTYVIDGQSYRLDYSTEKEVLKHIESDIWHMARERRDGQILVGRPKGSKNYKGRLYNEKDIKRLFNNVQAAVVGATIAARSATMDGMADDLLKQEVSKAQYDEYTGNLTGSYNATIVQKRRIVYIKSFAKFVDYNRIARHKGPKGGVYVFRRHSKHHGPAQRRSPNRLNVKNKKKGTIEKKDVRYIRSWESERYGYNPMLAYRGMYLYPGRLQGGDGRMQSGIIINNSAPYASAVHRRNGRRVLNNGSVMKVASKWNQKGVGLFRVASKSILQRAFGRRFRNMK